MPFYRRHLRHGIFDRVRYGFNFLGFMSSQAKRLTGTGTETANTFDNLTDTVTQAAHGYTTGDGPFVYTNAGGDLPTGIEADTPYWVDVLTTSTFQLYPTKEDALATTNVVTFSTDGTGVTSISEGADNETIFNALKEKTADQIRSLTSIDDL